MKKYSYIRNKEIYDKLHKELVVLKNSTTPEKIPAEWYKTLPYFELQTFKKEVLPKYGDYLSPRDRELLRNPRIVMADGEFYYTVALEQPWQWNILYSPARKPKKLTAADIEDELMDGLYRSWTETVPPWVVEDITEQEYMARVEEQRKEQEKLAEKIRAPSRREWRERAQKERGKEISDDDLEEYMWEHETQEQRLRREWNERMATKSSFVPGYKIYDHQIHRVMRICATIYVVYTYPIVLYTAIALVFLYYFVGTIYFYFELKDRAKRPFKVDPVSRKSEAWQREAWEADRKRWGFDKEDKDNKSNKKTK